MRDAPPGTGAVAMLMLVTALGTAAFWFGFFAGGEALHSSASDAYRAFEHAFPAADGWMAAWALAAGVGLLMRRRWAVLAGVVAGSALVFLGLIDTTFDVEQGMYAQRSAAMAVEAVINVFCLTVGPFAVGWFWRYRDALAPS
ncbi:MAG TPA: hypothetical protein VKU61_13950 [Candidatus Binatia bacterium]|nr:hypothetical protein [Candidatus Binatia bacterium]